MATRIAAAPEPVPSWVVAAIEAGGGEVVEPSDAEGLVWLVPTGAGDLRAVLAAAPAIRWVQLPWAGVEHFVDAELFDDGRRWTCGKGVYAEPVAEHALALGLAGLRRLPHRARVGRWEGGDGTSLFDGSVAVLGGGGITEALISLLAPFRCEITVVRRSDRPLAGASRTLGPDGVHEAVAGADLVVVALALTPETAGIVDASVLDRMEPHAWLVNVGRGRHVVTDDLVAALAAGAIGGAALDVTDPEPLPADHPLWSFDNCLITPHCANTPEMARAPLSRRIAENVRRFAAGEQLLGPVDPGAGY